MAWEPWLKARKTETEEQDEYDPNDPGLLVNILTKDMTEEDHERAQQWVMDHLLPES
jgi:hypothetical protein